MEVSEFTKVYHNNSYNQEDFNNYITKLVDKYKPKKISIGCNIGKYDFFTKTTQIKIEFEL